MKGKTIMIALLALLIVPVLAFAAPVEILSYKVNGGTVAGRQVVNAGEILEIEVQLNATEDNVDDVMVRGFIPGYRYTKYDDRIDSTKGPYDFGQAGETRWVSLEVEVPKDIDKRYTDVRVTVDPVTGESDEISIPLSLIGIDEDRGEAVEIVDVYLEPSNTVIAGRAVSLLVRLESYSTDILDDITITARIPELGIRSTETMDELEPDERKTSEELFLRIPSYAESGSYEVEVTVEFDKYETATETLTLHVQGEEEEEEARTVVTVPQAQEVRKGTSGAVYPIMISNEGGEAKTYTLTVSGVEPWGTSRLSNSVLIVQGESSGQAFLYITPDEDAQPGEKTFLLTISTPDQESKQVGIVANVVGEESDASGLRQGLEIGLIVLVVILIILGLVIGFQKLKGKEGEEGPTYY